MRKYLDENWSNWNNGKTQGEEITVNCDGFGAVIGVLAISFGDFL